MNERLQLFEKYLGEGMTTENMIKSLKLIGNATYDENTIEEMRLYSDFLPMMEIDPYTQEQRYLHILWEAIDQVPLGLDCGFSIPFRRLIAQKLFKKCGKGFVAAPRCTFNYGHRIEVGDFVAWNIGCFFDSKGTIKFGNNVMLAEDVKIFSHTHNFKNHMIREYAPVVIEDHVGIACSARILHGVRLGTGSIVAAQALVMHDVPANTLVAGIPAVPKGEVNREGGTLEEANHYLFANRAFQEPDAN